jgi:soluble lytic murein transglycosylase-like protein
MVRLALALLVLVACPAAARADIYSYTDEEGVRHFTNVQAPGKRFKLYLRTYRPPAPRPAGAVDDPARYSRFDDTIREASRLYLIPEPLIRAVIKVESNYFPTAVSAVGAQGLMQLMPGTARRMAVRDSFDPRQNILGGTRYLRWLANMFNGDIVLTIAGYNAGEGAILRYNGIPPFPETQGYVQRVLRYYYSFKANGAVAATVAGAEQEPAAAPAPSAAGAGGRSGGTN